MKHHQINYFTMLRHHCLDYFDFKDVDCGKNIPLNRWFANVNKDYKD